MLHLSRLIGQPVRDGSADAIGSIDDLIVVNARREPVGQVDSQDLPKLKLM